MAVGRFYDDIDTIINNMIEYLGVEDEDDYFDDLFDDDAIEEEDVLMSSPFSNELDAKIMKAVENTVKRLNKLNEACECELIESTTSDDICDFIHNAAVEAGLSEIPENVCDEWREF